MRLLVLGGTVFLGRHIVQSALDKGHDVTIFTRGLHNPELWPDVVKLRGDRDGDLKSLETGDWDSVVDTCGFYPRMVKMSAELLADKVRHYTFISSLSVYRDTREPGLDETAPVGVLDDPTIEEITGESYGPLKALCEQAAENAMPGRVLNVRAGLIVGPHDPSDRFTYWPVRAALGGDVLAPGNPNILTQFIDARDLAEWCVLMAEKNLTGIFNAVGPNDPMTMGTLLEECRMQFGSNARFVWVDEDFLLKESVQPWTELPLWIPTGDPNYAGFSAFSNTKAIDAGLIFRPISDTIKDTLIWASNRPADYQQRAGLDQAKERAILAKLHEHRE